MLALRHKFQGTDKRQRIEADRRRAREFNRRRDIQEKREDDAQTANDAAAAFAAAVTVSAPAPPERIAAFETTLTEYDTAVVQALLRNDELIALIDAEILALLGKAHVLADGRRVFRTEDGAQVFDEFGEEVGEDIIHPDAIDPSAPSWEAFSAKADERSELVRERADIFEYQGQLDAARAEIADGAISLDDLEAMEADLADSMPPSVALHVETKDLNAPMQDAKPDIDSQRTVDQISARSPGLDMIRPS